MFNTIKNAWKIPDLRKKILYTLLIIIVFRFGSVIPVSYTHLCMASIGQVSNIDHENVKIGKAGRKRHMGWRPTVRGSVMNPNDHPHGGGEGKSPIGRPGPVTPWGKPALGYKTRKTHNRSDKFIVKRRNGK